MSPTGFEPTIPASERPQTNALDRAASGISDTKLISIFWLLLKDGLAGYIGIFSGFGGLEVACWLLVPKFAGSHPAEAVGFLGRKNPQHAFLRRGSKAVGPMS